VSAGASAELDRLVAAMGQDLRARELLASEDEPGRVLDALRSLEGEAGAAVSAYLDLIGYRLLDGFDISEPCALQLSDVLLRAIRVAVAGRGRSAQSYCGRAGRYPLQRLIDDRGRNAKVID
jgi:integrase